MGGLPAGKMAWDTLGMGKIFLDRKEFTKRGMPASSSIFAGVIKPIIGATSNVRLEKDSKDPIFIALDGEPNIDEVTLSRFYNDDRCDWSGSLDATTERLQPFEPVEDKPDGCLIIDNIVIEKFGKDMQGQESCMTPRSRNSSRVMPS